jgi:hypothetical protein
MYVFWLVLSVLPPIDNAVAVNNNNNNNTQIPSDKNFIIVQMRAVTDGIRKKK